MEDDGFSLQDLAGLVRRRASLVGLVFFGILLSSFVLAYSLENLYKSTGVIVIDHSEVSDKFLPGTFRDTNPEQRIERIYEDIMTRDNLTDVIEKHSLYADRRDGGPARLVVPELRRNFELRFLLEDDDPRSKFNGDIIGFSLSFYHSSPEIARDVAQDLVALFQEGNRQRRQIAYLETEAALERESSSIRDQVSKLEEELAKFKSQHPGALPEDRNYNRQVIERRARDLDGLDREIRSLQERKTLLQSQLAQTDPWITALGPAGETLPTSSERLRTIQTEYLQKLGNYSADHPDVLRLKREIDSLSGDAVNPAFRQAVVSELNAKRMDLAAARRDYGTDHPDVRNLERAVAALDRQIADMPLGADDLPPPNNPIYLNLDIQINATDNELVALRNDRTSLQKESEELDRKIQIAPEVERRYLELTRDLDLARGQYEDTTSRLMSVRRAGVLEKEELAERYVVTQFPRLPYQPSFPNRPLFVVIGVFLGLTIGLGTGISAEALDGSIRNTRDIRTILKMPPIAAIPQISTEIDLGKMRTSRITYSTAIVIAVVATALYVHFQRGSVV